MLKSIDIQNYVLIDQMSTHFDGQLNIITGETGAGKSIILGALQLITGERADVSQLNNKEQKCTIEAVFDLSHSSLQHFFKENNLEYDSETIIRREIQPGGKSRAFINDSPVTLQILKDLSEYLIDIHSQNESLALKSPAYQLQIVDAFAGHDALLQEYAQLFQERKKKQKLLEQLLEDSQKTGIELDYLQFQYKELSDAQLDQIDLPKDEATLQSLTHAEEIKTVLFQINQMLQESENSLSDVLLTASQSMHKISKYNEDIRTQAEKLDGLRAEIKEWLKELSILENQVDVDPEKQLEIQDRINIIYKLFKKHHKASVEELIDMRQEVENKLQNITHSNERIAPLEKEIEALQKTLLEKSAIIHKNRKAVIPGCEKDIKNMLSGLGMPNANFVIEQTGDAERLNSSGMDEIRFMFAANKGSMLQELRKAISGGEMSRFMLCLKSLIAQKMQLPTLIFDEIDTGVSGDIAHKVGEMLTALSAKHQLIAITHLPQLASKGNHHLFVYKETDQTKTHTRIKVLDAEGRKQEIAKMLSGEKITETALANAKELLDSKPKGK